MPGQHQAHVAAAFLIRMCELPFAGVPPRRRRGCGRQRDGEQVVVTALPETLPHPLWGERSATQNMCCIE